MTLQAHADFGYFRPRFPERRTQFEFYPTPPSAIRALLSVERFAGDIWEPACGDARYREAHERAMESLNAAGLALGRAIEAGGSGPPTG